MISRYFVINSEMNLRLLAQFTISRNAVNLKCMSKKIVCICSIPCVYSSSIETFWGMHQEGNTSKKGDTF